MNDEHMDEHGVLCLGSCVYLVYTPGVGTWVGVDPPSISYPPSVEQSKNVVSRLSRIATGPTGVVGFQLHEVDLSQISSLNSDET
jgi:hypothetical protein